MLVKRRTENVKNEIKVIIPAAGAGKRLFPHTFTKPKPMVYIAGKPIIGHILDRMKDIEPEEIIIIVGYKKEQIMSYVDRYYSSIFKIRYVDQEEQLGLGHSIYTARDEIGNSKIMIALGDNIFGESYFEYYKQYYEQHLQCTDCAGSIGVIEVDDPGKYGIVELEGEYINKLEEKPLKPKSNLGIAGIYFINDTQALISELEKKISRNERTHGEYQLTDALQEMVAMGYKFKTIPILTRYDCGRTDSLLEVNRILLDGRKEMNHLERIKDSVIIQPVAIGDNVTIKNSIIGPHASIANDTYIESSIISDSVIGSRSYISKVNLQLSIVGDETKLQGKHNSLNIGDLSSIEF